MDETTAKALISAAFADVHSPDDTTTRVVSRLASQRQARCEPVRTLESGPASQRARIGIAAALGIALVSSAAYAAVRSGLLENAFGTKGQQDVAPTLVTGTFADGPQKEETFSEWRPGVTWENASAEDVRRLVADYAVDVDSSATISDATLTVEGFVTDENGLSVATYSLSSDSDLTAWVLDAGRGGFSFGEDSPISDIQVQGPGRESYGYPAKGVIDRTLTNGHALHVVMYYGAWSDDSARQPTTWQLCTDDGGPGDGRVTVEAPSKLMPAVMFETADGTEARVSISPIGAVVSSSQADATAELLVDDLSITYDEGSQEVLLSETVDNIPERFVRDDGSVGMLFNRLVDTDRVASVTLSYRVSCHEGTQRVTLARAN